MADSTSSSDGDIAALVAKLDPHPCPYCGGRGWTNDEGWSSYPYGKGSFREREEFDGLLPCVCNDDHLDRDEITEPIMVNGWWTADEQRAAAGALEALTAKRDRLRYAIEQAVIELEITEDGGGLSRDGVARVLRNVVEAA